MRREDAKRCGWMLVALAWAGIACSGIVQTQINDAGADAATMTPTDAGNSADGGAVACGPGSCDGGLGPFDLTVTVDTSITYQTIEGFGATHAGASFCGIDQMKDAAQRAAVIDATFNQVKLTMGELHIDPYEFVWTGPCSSTWSVTAASISQQND